jgi:hypothetical protein
MTGDEILRDYPHLEKADSPVVYAAAGRKGCSRQESQNVGRG